MKKEKLIELAEKINTGVATPEEVVLYNYWYESFQAERSEEESEVGEEIKTQMLEKIQQRMNNDKKKTYRVISFPKRIAAGVLLLLLAGSIYWFAQSDHSTSEEELLVLVDDVDPGSDKAVLTLSDGTKVVLDEAEKGKLAEEGEITVNKSGDGIVTYAASDPENHPGKVPDGSVAYNTISTPVGGKYKIVLPDDSEVWLNSLSSIRFPVSFRGEVREVEISGEVFFDVSHRPSQPFIVHSGDQTVRVLGTQFNLQAYPDEELIKTTLIEGSVKVNTRSREIEIKPGQQALYKTGEQIEVIEANTDQVVAWKNGLFHFWNTDLEEIMRSLARWYGVKVEYLNKPDQTGFTGFISRDVTIKNVLKMLEEAGNVRFGLEGNSVFVKTGFDLENK